MNAFVKTNNYAACFVGFKFDIHGDVVVARGKVQFSLVCENDSDCMILAEAPVSNQTAYYETTTQFGYVDVPYKQDLVAQDAICTITDSQGVVVMNGMPFLLTADQLRALNETLDEKSLDAAA